MMAQNLGRVQGFGDKPKGRSSSNLLAKFGNKIINKAKGTPGEVPCCRQEGCCRRREGGVWKGSGGGGAWGSV